MGGREGGGGDSEEGVRRKAKEGKGEEERERGGEEWKAACLQKNIERNVWVRAKGKRKL